MTVENVKTLIKTHALSLIFPTRNIARLDYSMKIRKLLQEIHETLSILKRKAWLFLVSNCFAVIHTESWQCLSDEDKRAASSQALCGGDEKRRPSKKPVLSSSLVINL